MLESSLNTPPPRPAQTVAADDSFTDGYGEAADGQRTLGGGVDFFSSLGKEQKRKDPNANKPNPDKVRSHFSLQEV